MSVNRVPPHNLDAEKAVLGGCLSSKEAINLAMEQLGEEDFYKPQHAKVFDACSKVYVRGDAVDHVSVLHQLNVNGEAAGQARLLVLECIDSYGTITDVKSGIKAVQETALKRRLISAGRDICDLGYEGEEASADVDEAEKLVFGVVKDRGVGPVAFGDELGSTLETIESGEVVRVSTGFSNLDAVLGGFRPGQFVVVAARPSMGKSALLGDFMDRCAREDKTSLLFSYEMGRDEVWARLFAAKARVPLDKIINRTADGHHFIRLGQAAGKIAEYGSNILVDDSAGKGMTELQATARRIAAKRPLGMILVDYLQLMPPGKADTREQQVSEISRSLKLMARELEVPVICAAQLNRGVEYRVDKRPLLSDLRESGSIEQDADIAMFIYRDEVYNPDTDQKGVAEVLIRKHRNGPTGTAYLTFLAQFTCFQDMAKTWQSPDQSPGQEQKRQEASDMLGPQSGPPELPPWGDDD